MNDSAPMTMRIVTPAGIAAEAACDSAVLYLRDDAGGKNGGLTGIWKDHASAVMALGPGPARATLGGETVLETVVSGGFASVRDNVITVVTDTVG